MSRNKETEIRDLFLLLESKLKTFQMNESEYFPYFRKGSSEIGLLCQNKSGFRELMNEVSDFPTKTTQEHYSKFRNRFPNYDTYRYRMKVYL